MSKDELHDIAQKDSPTRVDVPNTWQGLIVWAIARFGLGLVMAGVFGYATMRVYGDLRSDRAELFEAYKDAIRVMQTLEQTLDSRLEQNTRAIEEARRRAERGLR